MQYLAGSNSNPVGGSAVGVKFVQLVNAAYGLTGSGRLPEGPSCPAWVDSERFELATLAKSLSRIMGAPVADATDTKGAFILTLEWAPESSVPVTGAMERYLTLPALLCLQFYSSCSA